MTYIFITLSRTVFILEQKEVGYRRKCVWAGGVRGIRRSREAFLLVLFYFIFWGELVNMFVLHWSSPCWSKLNAEVSLFYFLPFHNPSFFFFFLFFGGRKTDLRTVPSLQSVCLHLLVVQFSPIGVACLVSPTSLVASQYD